MSFFIYTTALQLQRTLYKGVAKLLARVKFVAHGFESVGHRVLLDRTLDPKLTPVRTSIKRLEHGSKFLYNRMHVFWIGTKGEVDGD